MSVGKKGPYHLFLRDVPTSPATEVGLVLDLDQEGKPRVSESRIEPLPPRQSQGPVAWTSNDPMVDMVWAMDDWGDGGLRAYYQDGDNRYGIADAVDARWRGVLALNMRRDLTHSLFSVANSGWELGSAGDWTLSVGGAGNVAAVNTTLPRTGSYALQLGADDAVSPKPYAELIILPAANKDALNGRSVTFGIWTRPTSTNGGQVRISFFDGAGSQSGTATDLGATGVWTFITHTATITAPVTDLRVRIANVPPANLGLTFYTDDMMMRISGSDTVLGVVEAASNFYTAVGPLILQLDTTTANQSFWRIVFAETGGNTATGIVSFRDKVYVGYGTSARYVYGTGTSWTQVAAGSNDKAFYWVVVGERLWKSDTNTTLQHLATTADPALPTSDWLAAERATDDGAPITGLYELSGGVVVATERGLVLKDSIDEIFRPAYSPFKTDPDPENFQRGAVKDGWLYLTTAKQGLIRYNGARVEDLSELLISPRHTNFGGRVRAVAVDPHQVWVLLDIPALDASTTKTTRLLSLREVGGKLSVHPQFDVALGDINALAVAGTYLYALGRLAFSTSGTYYINSIRWWLPLKSTAPYQDEIGGRWLESSGYLELPVWHGGLPDTQKALTKVVAWVANTSATNYITVSFGVDGAAATTTNIGSNGRLNGTGAVQTLRASAQTTPSTTNIGRSFAVRLTFTRDTTQADPSTTRASGAHESPKLYAIAFHFSLRPDRVKQWEMFVRVGGNLRTNPPDPQGASTILTRLNTLETQVYPIELEEDFDQDETSTKSVVVIRKLERVFDPPDRQKPGPIGELYRLVLQEVT